jgi:hypothetical protein
MRFVIGTRGRPSLINLHPLREMKHVVCMFFSVNDSQFQKHQPDLERFVLNRESRIFQLMLAFMPLKHSQTA